jgi:hypothetical protein
MIAANVSCGCSCSSIIVVAVVGLDVAFFLLNVLLNILARYT